ncbi:MAG: YbaK/EbsC family protein [Anaerolineales bacterium]
METPPVSAALAALNIPHRVFHHAQRIESLEQAAAERGQRPAQVVRSILFRINADEFVMVLAAGAQQISWKALRKALNVSRVTMATEDEVFAVTGYKVGTVGPFGLRANIRILIEAQVLAEREISIGSGMRERAVILQSADLARALSSAKVVSLKE